jgi:hypothetical protein
MCILTFETWTLCTCEEDWLDCSSCPASTHFVSDATNRPNSYAEYEGNIDPLKRFGGSGVPKNCPKYYAKYTQTEGKCKNCSGKKEIVEGVAGKKKAVKENRGKAEGSRRIGDETDLGSGVANCVLS